MKAIWNNTVIGESDDTVLAEGNLYFPESSLNKAFVGSVALATDESDFGRDESHFLKRDGFFLPMHKIGRQKTSRCSAPS